MVDEVLPKLKKDIIEVLNLDMTIEEIGDDDAIFGDGLGLDSIDALELIVLLEKRYGIKLASAEEGKKVFASVRTMAEFIDAKTA